MRNATPDRDRVPRAAPVSFPSARLSRLAQLERWHFWFVARRKLLDRLLKTAHPHGVARVLDVGCGTGMNAAVLRAHARRVIAVDYRPEGLEACRQRPSDTFFVRANATHLPFADGIFDAVTVLDVLEHVDDESALHEIRRVLRPGGSILVTVPAMPWLWSYRDEAAGHLRRYGRRGLLQLLKGCRLELNRVTYYQCLLFPLVLVRLFGRKSSAARDREEAPLPVLNAVLCWISRVEVQLTRFVSWPFGSSIVAVCRRPKHEQPV
jgi:SAM-dependent methyltransferase